MRGSLIGYLSLVALLLPAPGCNFKSEQAAPEDTTIRHTASTERATRRAYDGAPPVIPHPRLGSSCVECHTQTGKAVPERGFAPANPHLKTDGFSLTANCRQCHLFQQSEELFVESEFVGLAQDLRRGQRLYPGAPPVIPHRVFMRENCSACHAGPSARPEIRCDHPERKNCRQCHVEQQTDQVWPVAASVAGNPSAP